jgi:transcriptional regulator with XRE-family HTH domain
MIKNDRMDDLLNTIFNNFSDEDLQTADMLSMIATAISSKRIELHLNQSQLAKKLGVTQAMISKWENGDYNFTIRQIVKIFNKLGLDVDIAIHPKNPYLADKNAMCNYNNEAFGRARKSTLPELKYFDDSFSKAS